MIKITLENKFNNLTRHNALRLRRRRPNEIGSDGCFALAE
jgi:hypothetical protein